MSEEVANGTTVADVPAEAEEEVAAAVPAAYPPVPALEAQDEAAEAKAQEDAADGGQHETFQPKQAGLREDVSSIVEVVGSTDHVSAKSWDDLNLSKELMSAIYEMGFARPSKIQEVALPIIIKGRNLIGQAHNGTGKTAAYTIGLLSLISAANRVPQAVVLCHTRELAQQVAGVVADLGKYLGIVISRMVPKVEWSGQPGQVLVGTPGKTLEWMKKRWVSVKDVKVLVLDEADVMLNQDNQMGPQVNMIRRFMSQELQTILFSATFPDQVRTFASQIVPRAAKIVVRKEELTVSNVHQLYLSAGTFDEKFAKLCEIYTYLTMIGQSIIFVNSRETAFKLAKKLKEEEGHTVSLICGTRGPGSNSAEQLDPKERDRIMTEFRDGVTKVLVATDVLARGIDVPSVTMVVNFELPLMFKFGEDRAAMASNMEDYLHRVGRTGRFGQPGIAINLVDSREQQLLQEIRTYFMCEIQMCPEYETLALQVKSLRPSAA